MPSTPKTKLCALVLSDMDDNASKGEARVDDGRAYFVMECVPDGSLAPRRSEMTTAGPEVIVPFLEKVALAVHHAHRQGVLHRDLKPADILLQRSEVRGQRTEVRRQQRNGGCFC